MSKNIINQFNIEKVTGQITQSQCKIDIANKEIIDTEYYSVTQLCQNEYYITGGFNDQLGGSQKQTFKITINDNTNNKQINFSFKKLPDLIGQRHCHKSIILCGFLFVIGGISITKDEQKFLNTCEKIQYTNDNAKWEIVPSLQQRRSQMSAFCTTFDIYVFGGFNDIGKQNLTFERLRANSGSAQWTTVEFENQKLLTHQSECLCLLYHDLILILGGSDGESSTNKIFQLNPSDKNRKITEVPKQLKSQRSRAIGSTLYYVHDAEFKTKNIFSNWLLVFGGNFNENQNNANVTYEMLDIDNLSNSEGVEKSCGKLDHTHLQQYF